MKRYFFAVFAAALLLVLAFGFGSFAHAQMVGVTLPSVPTGLAVVPTPPSQVSVSWSPSTESSGTIADYYVYRNGAHVATTPGTSFVDSGLAPGFYSYAVASYDASGNVSMQSSAVNVTLIADTTPPSVPTNVTVTGTTSTNSLYAEMPLTISWSPSTDNIGVAGYYVYRSGTQIVSSTSAFTGTSITDTVPPGTYSYAVVAYDAAQNFSNRSTPIQVTVAVDTTPPPAPTNVVAAQTSATSMNLSWATSTDSAGVLGYQVYRNNVQIATTTVPSYTDTGLSPEVTYAYSIAAYDVAGNLSLRSAPIPAMVQPANGPSAPYILSSALFGTSTVNVAWTFSEDSLAIAGYTVYRNGSVAATVTSTAYADTGLAPGTYTYMVSATDVAGLVSGTSSPSVAVVPVVTSSSVSLTLPLPAAQSAAPTNGVAPSSGPVATSTMALTQFLYFGLRSPQVQALQSILVGQEYLPPADATGFFGNLTLQALKKFQCDHAVVCAGGAGWGTVGPKTRSALNKL